MRRKRLKRCAAYAGCFFASCKRRMEVRSYLETQSVETPDLSFKPLPTRLTGFKKKSKRTLYIIQKGSNTIEKAYSVLILCSVQVNKASELWWVGSNDDYSCRYLLYTSVLSYAIHYKASCRSHLAARTVCIQLVALLVECKLNCLHLVFTASRLVRTTFLLSCLDLCLSIFDKLSLYLADG